MSRRETDIEVRHRERLSRSLNDIDVYDAQLRLAALQSSLESLGDKANPELYRHFPVASIASLESAFRATVVRLVNNSDEYTARGLKLAKERLRNSSAIDLIEVITRRTMTVGHIVGHVIQFNSVSSLEQAMTELLGTDFKTFARSATESHSRRIDDPPSNKRYPVVPDVDVLWSNLARGFEYRHIFAHESAPTVEYSHADASAVVAAVHTACNLMAAVIEHVAGRRTPPTRWERELIEARLESDSRSELANALWQARSLAKADDASERLRLGHRKWKEYVSGWLQLVHASSYDEQTVARRRRILYGQRTWAIREWIDDRTAEILTADDAPFFRASDPKG